MVIWNSMLLKIIIIPLGIVKQHARFIYVYFFNLTVHNLNSLRGTGIAQRYN